MSEYSTPNLSIVQLITKGRKLFLVSVYIEPRVDEASTLSRLEMFLKANEHAQIIIGGDFNGWHPAWGSRKTNKRGTDINNLAISHDLVIGNIGNTPTFSTVTHGRIRSSIIDLTLYSGNISNRIHNWQVNTHACPSSEHEAIDFTIHLGDIALTKNKKQSTYKYKTDGVDWQIFNNNLNNSIEVVNITHTLIENLNKDELDKHVSNIISSIQGVCDETFRIKKRHNNRTPWWNAELDQLKGQVIKIHHRLQDLIRSGKPITNIIQERNDLKEKYAQAIRQTSTNHFREFCNRQGKENVWSLTNRLLKNSPQAKPCLTVCTNKSTFTSSTSDTALSLLNKFYPDDVGDRTVTQRQVRAQMQEPPNTPDDKPFTEDEVIGCIESMSAKKAPGLDHLTADICLAYTRQYTDIVTRTMNRCLEISHFPKEWKIAQVKILPKPNRLDYSDTSSYRPIGLINIFGKLLEKLISKRITYHLDKSNFSNPSQYGFKEQTSTIDALKKAIDTIKIAKTNKEQVIAISLDIQAAFDNAWWPVLFHRLKQSGCPRNLYKIILNYVIDRKVLLNFADTTICKEMSRGCIQGSVCGPLFWNIILDDLLDIRLPQGCHIQAFADDVLLIVKNKNVVDLQSTANKALKAIVEWGEEVKLTFGPNKTQIIAFTPKAKAAKITFKETELKYVDDIKLLGIIIDKNLKFIKHVKYVINKSLNIYNKLSIYVRPTWGVHPENVRTIYKQVVEPTITYAAGVWGTATKFETVRNQLRSMQRGFAIKMIRSFRTVSATAAIALARLTPLHLKINEVAEIENTKMSGTTPFLPDDVTLDRPVKSRELLHPADRKRVEFSFATSQEEIGQICSPDCTQIYTDGSKHDDGKVGAAFVAYKADGRKVVKKFKLHHSCSVYQAELLAIEQACRWAIQNNIPDLAILTDSLSSLNELGNKDSTNPAAASIHESIKTINDNNHKANFIWVRSHVGLEGNEEADVAAKAAATSHKSFEFAKFPLSLVKYTMKTQNITHSNEIYTSSQTGAHTRQLCSTLETIHKLFTATEPTFELTQILTGHGYNLTYLNRFKIKTSDKCPCDSATPQTIKHLLEECPRYHSTRYEHISNCNFLNIDPFKIEEIIENQSCLDTFKKHVRQIISTLKLFNKDVV